MAQAVYARLWVVNVAAQVTERRHLLATFLMKANHVVVAFWQVGKHAVFLVLVDDGERVARYHFSSYHCHVFFCFTCKDKRTRFFLSDKKKRSRHECREQSVVNIFSCKIDVGRKMGTSLGQG